MGKEDFEKVQQWVANLVDTFEVGPDHTRVGVVHYSDTPTTAFELGHFDSREAVKAAARSLAYHGGHTNTGDALRYITRHSFSPLAGGRPGNRAFKQVAILLTDGRSQDLVLEAAAAAHRAGIRIFAVGVGAALREELEEIASEPTSAHVFHVSDFDAIDKIRGKLRRRLCESESAGAEGGGGVCSPLGALPSPLLEQGEAVWPGLVRPQPHGSSGPCPPFPGSAMRGAHCTYPAGACRQGVSRPPLPGLQKREGNWRGLGSNPATPS